MKSSPREKALSLRWVLYPEGELFSSLGSNRAIWYPQKAARRQASGCGFFSVPESFARGRRTRKHRLEAKPPCHQTRLGSALPQSTRGHPALCPQARELCVLAYCPHHPRHSCNCPVAPAHHQNGVPGVLLMCLWPTSKADLSSWVCV